MNALALDLPMDAARAALRAHRVTTQTPLRRGQRTGRTGQRDRASPARGTPVCTIAALGDDAVDCFVARAVVGAYCRLLSCCGRVVSPFREECGGLRAYKRRKRVGPMARDSRYFP